MAKENYFTFLHSLLNEDELNLNVEKATETIVECISNKNSIWIFGNGGSASTAEHFEADLSFVRHDSKNLKIKASKFWRLFYSFYFRFINIRFNQTKISESILGKIKSIDPLLNY